MEVGSLPRGTMNNRQINDYRWVMVGVLWLVHALTYMNISSLGILAPFIKEEFHLSSFQIGFLISALSIGSSLSQMPAGLLTDFTGVRRMLTLAIGSIGVLLVLFSLAPSYEIALLIILIHGAATGIVGPATSKSVLDWFPSAGRATAMGVKQTGVNFGGIFAGLLLPALAIALSWRRGLLAVGLVEAVLAFLIYRLAKESPLRADVPPGPLAWKKILHMAMRRDMLILGGISFCFMASQFCFSTYLILFLTQEMHYSIVRAGQWFAISFLVGAAGRILWSLASDYWLAGRRKGVLGLIALILFLSSLALGTISLVPVVSPLLAVAMLAFGISGIGWNAIYLTLVGESVDMESTGLATGVGYFYGFLGSLIAPPLFGLVVDTTDAYGYAWLFLTLCAGAVLVLLTFYREKKPCKVMKKCV
jgi:MFS transporter, ACS family, hexuronate transporter